MSKWPHHITYALDMLLLYNSPTDEEYIDELMYYWGGYESDALVRALREGDEQDRLVALHALGYAATDQARDILVPYLGCNNPLERWASAIGLGRVHDERALPVLLTMLTEFLPPDATYASSLYYRGWRFFVPWILQTWGEPRFVPLLRHALQEAVRVEQALPPPDPRRQSERDDWVWYQEALVYALGRLGALGALTEIAGAAEHLDIWRVHLAMGYLHGRHHVTSIKLWADHPGLLRDVISVLEHYFGLGEEERKRCLAHYEIEESFRIAEMYRVERERAEGKIF